MQSLIKDLSTKNQSELAKRIETAHQANVVCYDGIDGGVMWRTDKMCGYKSVHKVDWLNSVFSYSRPGGVPKAEIQQVVERFGDNPFTWYTGVFTEDTELVHQSLLEFGFEHTGINVCMILRPERFQPIADVENFEVFRMTKSSQVDEWLSPFNAAFEVPEPVEGLFRTYVGQDLIETKYEHRFIGYYCGQPVSCSSYFVFDEQAVIYNVGTLPGFRRKKFATKLVEAAVSHAFASGVTTPVALYATEQGAPVYLSMGFERLYDMHKIVFKNKQDVTG